MKAEQHLRAFGTIWAFSPHPAAPAASSRVSDGGWGRTSALAHRLAFAAAGLALLALGQGRAQAQAWPPPNPYIQPVPNQQSSYAQLPQYAPPSSYGQQNYPQPYGEQAPYPQQQPYAQQPDSQSPYDQQNQPYPPDDYSQPQGQSQPAQPLDPQQLEQLVAPIALYPDSLVAQVLAAATYPAQVVAADRWRQSMGYAPADQIVAGADAQNWDPSVKALTAFPQVLAMMDRNLQWTTALGNAYYNQPQDVLQTIQVMRQRAEAAGTLESTPQETVTNDEGYIQLAPATPAVVYVPAYNPWDVYGEPVTPYSGFSLLGTIGSALLNYGPGIAMTAFRATPWGWLSWGLNWLASSVLFNHSTYYSHSATVAHWNFPHRPFPERGGAGVPGERYNRFARGDTWADGRYPAQRPEPLARQPERFQEDRPFAGPRPEFTQPQRNGVRPAFGNDRSFGSLPARPQPYGNRPQEFPSRPQPYASRPQEAYNRAPEPARPNYGNGFASRPSEGYGFRSGESFSRPTPEYRAPQVAQQRGNFGERFSEPPMGSGFAAQQFKAEKSGGFHLFGGGHKSEPSFGGYGGGRMPKEFREPKMPKSFGHEKMPKAPHYSAPHSSGGHGHSGGGHFGGGHHR